MFDILASSLKHNNRFLRIQSYIHQIINVFKAIYNYSTRSLILSDVVAEITKSWEAELLDFLILIKVVPGISAMVQSLGHF